MHPLDRLQRLRSWREPRPRDASIATSIDLIARDAKRAQKRLGDLAELWREQVPAPLECRSALTGLRSGVLHVVVEDAATSFELDRLLRGGLMKRMQERYRGSLVRVRVRIGVLEQPEKPTAQRAAVAGPKPGASGRGPRADARR